MDPIYCDNIGNKTGLRCCYPDRQDDPTCHRLFINKTATDRAFRDDHDGSYLGDWCWNVKNIYSSYLANDPTTGTGRAPQQQFLDCANVPNMARYRRDRVLQPNISPKIEQHVPPNFDDQDLKKVTFAVTECLIATCRTSRDSGACRRDCSAVNLLINSTAPNLRGLDDCMGTLCTGGYNSLPYADADIAGIGVFVSYTAQCAWIVLLLIGLSYFEIAGHKHSNSKDKGDADGISMQSKKQVADGSPMPNVQSDEQTADTDPSHECCSKGPRKRKDLQELFDDHIVDFHKAQCFFSATIQVAALTYGILDLDILNTFLFTPLATNAVLPIVFAYILLLRREKASLEVIALTTICWLLATIVYWVLYKNIIFVNEKYSDENKRYKAYQQFRYKLSAIADCGGYSALAACPGNFNLPENSIVSVSKRLRILTPIIWGFSTIMLLIGLLEGFRHWRFEHAMRQHDRSMGTARPRKPRSLLFENDVLYWVVILCFLGGTGVQWCLLEVWTLLKMTDAADWSFGQIIAVAIWVPPAVTYLFSLADHEEAKAK